ncbi:MAG: hypothetical protein O2968_21075 [Acidobacteria bacterium]|nr:hypothetical protein [Acidobacteriota bacterium]
MLNRKEFYIGYAATAPRGLAKFRARAVMALLLAGPLIATILVLAQQPFVSSVFEFLQYETFAGVIEERPYPTLLVKRPGQTAAGSEFSRYLLTVVGKQSAAPVVDGLEGKSVRLEGALIYLGGETMIEIKDGSLEQVSTALTDISEPTSEGTATFEGEIVDTKCWLGVMNPGKGKVHKACAIRCISGGLPPALLVHDEHGRSSMLLLVGLDGRPLNKEVLNIVATPLRVTGEVKRKGDSRFLYAEPSDFQPLRQ